MSNEVDPLADQVATGRGEGIGELKDVAGLSQNQLVGRRFIRHAGAVFGIVVIVGIAVLSFSSMGIFGLPGWWQYQDHNATYGGVVNGGQPTLSWSGLGDHPFGQDMIGRDNFAMVMRGIQTSMLVMTVLGLLTLAIGTIVGAIAGYYRGPLDTLLMRGTDLVITLPVIVLGAVLGKLVSEIPDRLGMTAAARATFRENIPLMLAVFLGLILWPSLARLVRSEFLTLREREFVDAARVAGASDWRIITKHMLPNSISVIIVNTTLTMSSAVVLEAALSFLGFGVTEPNVSLGKLISDYQTAFLTRPWLFWWPGLFIILLALSINFIGDGLRDAFDPRTKRIPSKRTMDAALAAEERKAGTHE
ncbi:MAG: ABC transporter permease [Propioniciclava sp.]